MCQADGRLFGKCWLPLSFLKGKKLVVLGLGGHQQFGLWNFGATWSNLPSQPPWQCLHNLNMFLPVDPPSGRLPSLSITWKVCHRSNPSSAPPHDLGENGWGRKLLKLANVLRGKHPSLTQFPYQPSIIGIVLDSAHWALSHCYNVHPRSSAHHPRLCQYQRSVPTLQDNLVKILLHRARGVQSLQLAHWYMVKSHPPTLVSHCIFSVLVPKDGEFIFMCASSLCCLPHLQCPKLSDWSDLDDIEDVVDNELLSLSKPWSGEGEGNQGDWGLWSLHFLLHSQPLEGQWGDGG